MFKNFILPQIILITDGVDCLTDDSSLKLFYDTTILNIKQNYNISDLQVNKINLMIDFNQNETLTDYSNAHNNTPNNNDTNNLKFPFVFPNQLNILILEENNMRNENKKYFYLIELIKLNNNRGNLFITKNLNFNYLINDYLLNIKNVLFEKFISNLKFGHLESNIMLVPKPLKYKG